MRRLVLATAYAVCVALSALLWAWHRYLTASLLSVPALFSALLLGQVAGSRSLYLLVAAIVLWPLSPVAAVGAASLPLAWLLHAVPRMCRAPEARWSLEVLAFALGSLATLFGLSERLWLSLAVSLCLGLALYGLWRRVERVWPLLVALSYSSTALIASLALEPSLAPLPLALVAAALPRLGAELRRLVARREVVLRPPRELKPFALANAVMAGVFGLDLLAGLVLVGSRSLPLALAGSIVAGYGLVGAAYYGWRAVHLRPELRLRPFKSRWFVAWFVARDWAWRLLESYAEKLRPLLDRAAVTQNPIIYAARRAMASIVLLALTPLPLALCILSPTATAMGCLAMLLGAGLALAEPFITLPSKIGDRRRSVEDELPWFALYAASLQAAGIPLYECFKRLIGKGLLRAIEREARFVEKRIMVLGRDAITAMEEVARDHPSKLFRDFILGYTSILRTGGDLVSYLESRVREYLQWLSFRFRRYAESVASIGEINVALFTILVSVFAIAGGMASVGMVAAAVMAVPCIAVGMYVVISSAQPRMRYSISVTHFVPALLAGVAALVVVRAGLHDWSAAVLVAMVLSAGYGAQYSWQMRIARAHEAALEDFLRDVTEMRKIGLPPSRAITALARQRTYNKHFDALIKRLDAMLRLSIPLGEAVARVYTPSWLTRMVLFIIGEIEASGGGTVRVLENLTEFVASYTAARREMVSRVRLMDALAIMNPLLLGVFVSVASGLAKVFGAQLHGFAAAVSFAGLSAPPIFVPSQRSIEAARVLTAEASIALAVLASKAIDGTVKSQLRTVIVCAMLLLYTSLLDPVVQTMVIHWFSTAP